MVLDILNVAYDLALPSDEWLDALVHAYCRAFPGSQRIGFLYESNDTGFVLPYGYASPDGVDERRVLHVMEDISSTYRDARVLVNLHDSIQSSKLSARLAELGRSDVLEKFREYGVTDAAAVCSGNASGRGFLFANLLEDSNAASPGPEWLQIAAHVASAARLRFDLVDPTLDSAEWVMDPSTGRVESANGRANGASALESLRSAAIRFDRARSDEGKRNPEETLDRWTALVSGRWSIVDTFDTDGRRFVVALPNPPEARSTVALTRRQAQVVEFVLQGHAQKFIAYELGLSPSTVAHHLGQVRSRLRVRSNAELIAKLNRTLSGQMTPASRSSQVLKPRWISRWPTRKLSSSHASVME